MVHGNQGSEFIFVQASTSITLGDFVVVTNNFFANSMTTTNIASTLGADIAQVGAILAQSVTFIPAGAFFWAALRGHNLPGNANDAVVAGAPVQLFTSATAGIVTSTSGGVGLAGIEVISSVTPLFKLTWPRASVSNSLAAPLSNA
jgi:predicted RecA/RadA family phage recombinase